MWRRIVAIVLLLGFTASYSGAAVFVRLTDKEDIDSIIDIEGLTWVASKTGAYRIDGNSATKVFSDARVTSIAAVGNKVWLGTAKGLYESTQDGGRWSPVSGGPDAVITALVPGSQEIWVGTDGQGVYRYAGGVFEPLLPHQTIFSIRKARDQLWVVSNLNAYRWVNDELVSLFPGRKSVHQVEPVAGELWFLAREPTYRFGLVYECHRLAADGSVERALESYDVTTLKEVAGELWFATIDGSIFRIDAGTQRLVTKGDFIVNTIDTNGHGVWLGTTDGSYLLEDGVFSPIPRFGRGLNVLRFSQSSGHTWIGSSLGAYRFDEDVEVFLRPGHRLSLPVLGYEVFLGKKTGIKEFRYDRQGKEPYGDAVSPGFEVVIHKDSGAVRRDMLLKEGERFNPTLSYQVEVSQGLTLLYAGARDEFGNAFEIGPVKVYSIGFWWIVVRCGLPIFLIGLINVIFFPRSERVANVIAGLLKVFGSGIEPKDVISFYQAVPAIRARTLRFYFKAVSQRADSLAIRQQYTRHPAEFRADYFLDYLHDKRVLALSDHSGEGERYLEYLTWGIANERNEELDERRVVPVFVDFEVYRGGKITEGVLNQLKSIGGIHETTARCLLHHEVFVFLLDGTGLQLSKNDRNEIVRFVEEHSAGNRLVVCSSEQYEELKKYAVIDLTSVSKSS